MIRILNPKTFLSRKAKFMRLGLLRLPYLNTELQNENKLLHLSD